MAGQPQSFEHHVRFVPAYHGGAGIILLVNLVWSVYRAVTAFGGDTLVQALVAVALILLFLYARRFAVTVQDRVIRLEMRLRLASLLPADLAPRVGQLTVDQLVALRFASDAELPALTRQVLTERLTDRKAIKRLVKDWQADELRA
jgi:hypothetical protein